MAWVKRTLRGTEVWAKARQGGTLETGSDGRVEIKYRLDEDAKVYRAAAKNLAVAQGGDQSEPDVEPDVETRPTQHDPKAVVIYTDGACTGNPGPMGIGVVVSIDGTRKELSEYLGQGTNNIAELTAIERALDAVPAASVDRDVLVHTDSSYAIGLLARGFKAKANQELVERLRRKARRFPRLRFVKVAGHAGVRDNERCDELAREAISRRQGQAS